MTQDSPSWNGILENLEAYLKLQKDEGVQAVEASPQTVMSLGQAPPRKREAQARAATAASPEPHVSAESELTRMAQSIAACKKCELHEKRHKTVPGQGSSNPDILFVGEGPGADEDRQGLAFVGRAGRLLTKMIEAMGYTRDDVFIGNIVKCRPPGNRKPTPAEMETCVPYLKAQIAVLKPKVIVAMGATAVEGLVDTGIGITRLRGSWLKFEGIPLMPTFHPAYLLRNPSVKRDTWEDLKSVLKSLGKNPPSTKKSG